jgi:TRAP transporter 4TM/12TM fusion protein
MDGPITIPMMTRTGYPGHIAAAIEALASTGGQIMPPVMGITAFLIADWLSIPYSEVVIAAIMPALLYYLALFVQVDLEAAKRGLVGLPAADLPRLATTLRSGWVFIVPFAVLVYTLVFDAWEPGRSAMAAVIAAIAVGLIQPETRPTLRKLWIACIETGRTLLDLVAIVAIAGLVIGALQISGLAFSLSLILTSLADGSLFALLLLTAALSIVLGMGLPSAVIYILLAVLVAPGLVKFGVPELAAHMYLFYFGMLSMITPPMCFATFAAATIAGCDFWKAGWAGVRLGIVAYIIPFMFVYQPEILLQGEPLRIVLSLGSAMIAVTFLAAAVAGYVFAPLDPVKRTLLVLAAIALVPSPATDAFAAASNIAGLALGLGVCALQLRSKTMRARLINNR